MSNIKHVIKTILRILVQTLTKTPHVTVYRSSCGLSFIRTAGNEDEARRRGRVQFQELGAWLQKLYRRDYRLGNVGKH